MLFCSLLCSLSIRFNLKSPSPLKYTSTLFFIFAVWSTQMRNCQEPWFVLTSYRSLQSCMPRVHAGRAERRGERRGIRRRGGERREETGRERRGKEKRAEIRLFYWFLWIHNVKCAINPGEIKTVRATGLVWLTAYQCWDSDSKEYSLISIKSDDFTYHSLASVG